MKSIFNLFRSTPKVKSDDNDNWFKGHNAFEKGKKLTEDKQYNEALIFLDEAIKCEFLEDSHLYRGICLQALGFDLDAIEDFNKEIEKLPEDANRYFLRSFSKVVTGDLEGCITDREDAVRLSKIDNNINRSYNLYAKEQGSESVTYLYNTFLHQARIYLSEKIERSNYSQEEKELFWGKEKWPLHHYEKINKKRRYK